MSDLTVGDRVRIWANQGMGEKSRGEVTAITDDGWYHIRMDNSRPYIGRRHQIDPLHSRGNR